MMGITITNQTNNSECACCVITSLYNYFNKSKVDKENVLQEAQFENLGLSIFDFEQLALKFNIKCESFNVEWAEFKDLRYNGYFVCLTKKDEIFHYTIIRKKNKIITIYDSIDGKKNIDYNSFNKIYSNIVIFVRKELTNQKKYVTKDFYHFINVRYVILSFVISFSTLCISILLANFLNSIISVAINNNSISNLITIIFFFGMLYLFENILNYIEILFSKTNYKNIFNMLLNNLFKKLLIKEHSFCEKINLNWLYRIDECIDCIAEFLTNSINQLLSNIFLFAMSTTLICVLNYWFIFIVLIVFLYKLGFLFIKFKKQNEILKSLINLDNENNDNIRNLINHFGYENNINQRETLINKIKENYSKLFVTFNETIFFSANTNFFETLIENFIYIVVIGLGSYLIIQNNEIDIGELTFILGLIHLNKGATNELTSFFVAKAKYKFYYQIYFDIISVGNIKNIDKEFNLKIESIYLKSTITNQKILLKNNSLIKKNEFKKFYQSNNFEIYFNNLKQNFQSSNIIQSKIVVLNSNSKFSIESLIKNLNSNNALLVKAISFFQTNLDEKNSDHYQQLLINIASLINVENKIIIFCDTIKNLKKEHKIFFKKEIIPHLQKNNFILWVC